MYKYIKDDSNFYDLALELSEGNTSVVYCDTETQGLDARQHKILLFQVMANDEIFIFDFLKLNNEHLKYLVNLLENVAKVTSVWHNAKFDLKFIAHNTGIWMNRAFDTMNAEVLLNAGIGKSTYKLSELALKYAGVELSKEDRSLFYETEVTNITDQMLQYGAMDVKVLKDIYIQQSQLIKETKLEKIVEFEMPLLPVIAKMEYNGVLLDTGAWKTLEANERLRLDRVGEAILDGFIDEIDLSGYSDTFQIASALAIPIKTQKLKRELETFTTKEVMKNWVRQNFNLASPKQLKTGLKLIGINVESTDKKVLKKLKSSKLVDALLEKSECAKRISTYGLGVLEFINPVSGRIHTEFLNNGAATGRLSSGNPINLQNIPNATGYRESFISSPDYDWLSLDYSQQEFRLAGAISGEQKIIDAYIQGADMHTATASIIYNKPLNEITKSERFIGKTSNFTIIYGGTEYALGRNLGLSKDKSLEILKAFHEGYPTFSQFKECAENMILERGYSSTVLGRKRYNPPKPTYMNNNEYMQYVNKIKREGFNHIIQGTAADITKLAMIGIYKNNPFGDKLRMLIQVHDEINLEAHKSISRDAVEFVRTEMLNAEQPFLGSIPAAADSLIGEHWIH